jgi:hypothetical protein
MKEGKIINNNFFMSDNLQTLISNIERSNEGIMEDVQNIRKILETHDLGKDVEFKIEDFLQGVEFEVYEIDRYLGEIDKIART